METIKIIVVGDGHVGKTQMIVMYTNKEHLDDYVPTVIDSFITNIWYKNKMYLMEIWDTAGQEDYAYLRPLSYSHADVFLICFSIDQPASFKNVENVWFPEVRHFCRNAVIILVGTKIDLRDDKTIIDKLSKKGRTLITFEEGKLLAERMRAHAYVECSALKRIGLKEAFDSGLVAFFERKEQPSGRRKCSFL